MNGKEKCELLRQIRKEVARINGIPYEPTECTYQGEDCQGTCPKCDEEIDYLNAQLNKKSAQHERVDYRTSVDVHANTDQYAMAHEAKATKIALDYIRGDMNSLVQEIEQYLKDTTDISSADRQQLVYMKAELEDMREYMNEVIEGNHGLIEYLEYTQRYIDQMERQFRRIVSNGWLDRSFFKPKAPEPLLGVIIMPPEQSESRAREALEWMHKLDYTQYGDILDEIEKEILGAEKESSADSQKKE